jgi:DNA-binding transcriptional MocR family regulator
VAVETPVYFGLLQTLEGLGLKALEIPARRRPACRWRRWNCAAPRPGGEVPGVCAHFRTTGALMPDDNKKRLLALARHGVTIIEDDVFGDLHYGNGRPTPLKAWDRDGDVIYCASFTKSFAPSFRLGWLAAGRHHGALARLCASSTLVSSPLLQVVLADVLDSGDYARISQRLRLQLAAQMTATADAVLQHFPRGTRVRRPQGGVVLWVECPETVDSTRLLQHALAEGISFAPGVAFSAAPRFGHCLRASSS